MSSEPPLRKCRSYLGEWAQPHTDPDCGHQPEWSHFGQRRLFGNELRLLGKKEPGIHVFGILELGRIDSAHARGVGLVRRNIRQARMRCKPEQVGRALEYSFSLRSYPALATIDYTLDTGAGDCEDYAILKYVALREAGMSCNDLRILVVRYPPGLVQPVPLTPTPLISSQTSTACLVACDTQVMNCQNACVERLRGRGPDWPYVRLVVRSISSQRRSTSSLALSSWR